MASISIPGGPLEAEQLAQELRQRGMNDVAWSSGDDIVHITFETTRNETVREALAKQQLPSAEEKR